MGFLRQTKTATPLDDIALVLSDLDGVVYRGKEAIPGAVSALTSAAQNARVAYITNNASRTAAQVAEHLRSFGLGVEAADIVTSPQAAVLLLQRIVAPGALILVVGGEGIVEELTKAGYRITRSAADNPAAVVQGFAPEIGWKDLAEAAFALAEPVDGSAALPWIATNTDWTLPLEKGLAPGNGTLVSAVHTAVQRLPQFAGKPETPIYEEAARRFGNAPALMLGDRLDTDTKGARAAGIKSVHVLTGVDRPKQLIAASSDMRPDYILATLGDLATPYPEIKQTRDGGFKVGDSCVRMNGHIAEVVREGTDPLDLLRAGCAAVWNSGLAIYGLKIPDILLEDHWL